VLLLLERTPYARLKWRGPCLLAAVVFCCVAIAGCTTPVGVERVDPQAAYQERARSVLLSGALSEPTRVVLTRWDLNNRFETDPESVLATLQGRIVNGAATSDEIYALAELSFQHAERTGQRAYYLAAAVYAFAFLFPDGADASPSPYDPRLRIASDLYDRGLTLAFESADR
jgi:hypothetical protein